MPTLTISPATPLLGLLGLASLRLPDEQRRLERKAAGLLAYLALEGQTARSVLAGLLWPEVSEHAARSNLRQALRRLRRLQPGLVAGADPLRLDPDTLADVAQLELAVFQGHDGQVLGFSGELLEGLDYDDCPEFLDWLVVQRERLLSHRCQARSRQSVASEASGDLEAALHHARRVLELDPVSEVAHRRVMRLHALRGDRGAALQAFLRCVSILERELGVSPTPETRALAQTLEHDTLEHAAPPEPVSPPASTRAILASAPLVGRETEWARLEEAWAHGQTLLVCGPPGVGKSRLLHDFLAAQGPLHVFQGRPGDEAVPYLSLARAFRRLLPLLSGAALAGWVRAELARILPELAEPGLAGVGMAATAQGEAEPLRFSEACGRFLALALERGPRLLLLDDIQCCDEPSLVVWNSLLGQPALAALGMRAGLTFRPEELPPARLEAFSRLGETQAAVQIALTPLTPEGVAAMLSGVLPHLGAELRAGLAPALARHTGGNPLFLLETLRSLSESGDLERAAAGPLPLPARLGPLIARRLERLSPAAGRVAQVAAVAGADLTPDLAAAVLEVHPLELARPWAELEAAQIMRGPAFAHDLMAQAARTSVPAPIRGLLHARVAAALEAGPHRPEAARVAHHWQEAAEPGRAAAWWVQAGWDFVRRGVWEEAAAVFVRVIQTPAADDHTRQDARYGLGRTLVGADPEQAEQHLLLALAARPGHPAPSRRRESELRATLSELYRICGRLDEGGEQIRQAIERAPEDASGQERSQLWRASFWIELRSGRLNEAEEAIRQARTLAPGDPWVANEHALLLWHSGRFQEAAQMYGALAHLRREAGEPEEESRAAFGSNRAWTFWALGRNTEAEALLGRPYQPAGSPFEEALRRANYSTVLTSLGRSADALGELAQAEAVMRVYPLHLVDVLHRRSVVYHRAERHGEALPLLQEALPLARQVGDPYRLSYTLTSLAAAQAHLGDLEAAQAHAAEALGTARQIGFPLTLAIAHQGGSLVARLMGQRAGAVRQATSAAELARACGLVEQLGQALLLQGLASETPVAALTEALELGRRHALPDLIWRAASALAECVEEQQEAYLNIAVQARNQLRALAPPGWF